MSTNSFQIFAVSDATGSLAHNLARAASMQFEKIPFKIVRCSQVDNDQKIRDVILKAKEKNAVILFTMVSQDLRRVVLSEAKKASVVAMDIMGPALDMLSHYFHQLPLNEPGLQYRVTQDYYHRTEALDFAVRHDDGLSVNTFDQADIILLGISRTSKTPLAIYLAYQGYRCANITIVQGMPLPPIIFKLDPKKMVGLILSPDKLASIRSTRLKKLGRPDSERYAQVEHIQEELNQACEVFDKLPGIHIVDVTGKAIEELSSEVIHKLRLL